MRINNRKDLIISTHNDLCAHIFPLLFVFARTCSDSAFYVCSYLYVSMHVIMISMNNACAVVLFIQFQLLFLPPQTTLRRQVSGHLAVNKVELIDFNSGQHPSAKHSPGSELNKLPPGTDFRSAVMIYVLWCVCFVFLFFFFGRGGGVFARLRKIERELVLYG